MNDGSRQGQKTWTLLIHKPGGWDGGCCIHRKKKSARVLSLITSIFLGGGCSILIIYKIWAQKIQNPQRDHFSYLPFLMCLNSVLSSVITTLVIDRDNVTKDPESSIWNASPVSLKGAGACLLIPNGSRPPRNTWDVYYQRKVQNKTGWLSLWISPSPKVSHSCAIVSSCIFTRLISSVCMLCVQESKRGVIALKRITYCLIEVSLNSAIFLKK